ncbi:MAG: protein kinase [Anaerolineae bacterium]|nr:protein kinase [Anaerolineae bacterium]
MTLREDTILENRYRIDNLLAQGGMGAIYQAFDLNLNTPVAIKENSLQTSDHVEQFRQEALILARLRHAGLPRVIHHFSLAGRQYLVMDFIEGRNLWEIVTERGGPIPVVPALDYMIQICQAVSHLHKQIPPIIHRDIKPQNIKITPAGRAVLVDFGIAKEISLDFYKTQAGAQRATSGFSPPEQYTGAGTTPASDIYALGATLYALLTAKKPPRSTNLIDGDVKFEPPNVINPDLNPQVTQAIVHAMQLKPEDRPDSVGAWQQRLETIWAALSAAPAVDDATMFSRKNKNQVVDADIADDDDIDDDVTIVGVIPNAPTSEPVLYWLVDPKGDVYEIEAEPLSIGRAITADIVVEDLGVSRTHAQIRTEADSCLIRDLDSANGTFLNGEPLSNGWQPLEQGDIVTVGSAEFHVTSTQPKKVATSRAAAGPSPIEVDAATLPLVQSAEDDMSADDYIDAPVDAPAQSSSAGRFLWLGVALLALLLCGMLALGAFIWFQFGPEIGDGTVANQSDADSEEFVPLGSQPLNETEAAMSEPTDAELAPATDPNSPIATPTVEAPATRIRVSVGDVLTRADTIDLSMAATSEATDESSPTTEPEPEGTVESASEGDDAELESETTGGEPTPIPVDAVETLDQLGAREVIDVDFNPQNYNEVYAVVKGAGIYKSTSGGAGPWLKLNIDGSGITGLTIDPTNPERLYAPGWNAVLKSTDGGNTWEVKSNGLSSANRSVNELVVHPTQPDTLFGGIGETLIVSTDGGETWVSDGYGRDMGGSQLNDIVIDPFATETIYVAPLAGSLFKSTDGGRNFIGLPFNIGEGAFALAAHPTQPNVYLVGVNATHSAIAKSTDGFEFYTVSDGLVYGGADTPYSAIAYAPSSPNIVYAGSGYENNMQAKGLFKSTDDGETWFPINSNIALNPDTGYPYYIKSIVVHPSDPNNVLVATGGGLFHSTDGGTTWSLL